MFYVIFVKPKERWRVEKSKKVQKKIAQINNPAQAFSFLRKIDHFLFEELILTAIDKFNPNVEVVRNKRYTGDGGIDGVIKLNGITVAIQAKKYTNEINTSDVAKLETDMNKVGASIGLFVHTGKTRPATWKNSEGKNVIIISGARMLALVQRGKLPLELFERCN